MKNKKGFLFAVLSLLSISSLAACGGGGAPQEEEEKEEPIYQVGDTVVKWSSKKDFDGIPMDVPEGITGTREVYTKLGNKDTSSLYFEVTGGSSGSSYISSDAVEEMYFTDDHAKNGDIISLYFYLPEGHNIDTLKLEALTYQNESFAGTQIKVDSTKENEWIRTTVVYDTLDVLGSIRLNYKVVDKEQPAKFYVDDIEITFGAETNTSSKYVCNDESLREVYKDYFKVGTCMPANLLNNNEARQLIKDNFNSLTAENEGKPERVLDRDQCRANVSRDNAYVAITLSPFERMYDFAEAHHIGVRHHTFVWYSQTPGWFFTEDYSDNGKLASRQLMLRRMDNFIKETMDTINNRWPGLIYAIDVSNEAIDNGIRKNNNKWYDTVGEDFVYQAFVCAHKYKEDYQELYYNDYSYDYQTENCEFALNTLLEKAIEEELIDGVGIQGHIDCDGNPENKAEVLINDAKLIKAKGLKCQITELDITINGTDETALNRQKTCYKHLIKRALQCNESGETDINAIIVWGTTDDTSWKRSQSPLLFNSDFSKKPAYYGFLEGLEAYETVEEE